MPIVAAKFTRGLVPIAAAEIIAGMIFGRSGFDLIHESAWIDFLSLFGFAMLMFLSGLEVDFHRVADAARWDRWRPRSLPSNPVASGLILLAGTLGLAILVSWALFRDEPFSTVLFFALVLSTTSVGVVVPTLRERGLTNTSLGQTILMSATLADFLTVLTLTVVAALIAGSVSAELWLIAVLFVPFIIVVTAGTHLGPVRWVRHLIADLALGTAQIRIRGALVLLVLFVVLAEYVEAELVLGAFLAGAAVSSLSREEGSDMRQKLDAIGFGFVVPIFFVTVGAEFDLNALSGAGYLLPFLLVAAAFAIKIVPALLLRAAYSWRDSIGAGVLLSSRLSLIIAASVIGVELGVIDHEMNAAIIFVAVITSTLAPSLFLRMVPSVLRRGGLFLVIGGGDTGMLLAERLRSPASEAVLIDTDPAVIEKARALGIQAVHGSGLDPEILIQAGAEDAAGFVAVTHSDSVNFQACLLARDRFEIENVAADVNDHDRVAEFARHGIKTIGTSMAVAVSLDNLVERPDLFSMLASPHGISDIVQINVTNQDVEGHRLEDLHLPGDAIILLIHRGETSFVPHPDSTLEVGDVATVAVEQDSIEETVYILNESHVVYPRPR
jgi:Kef-type K+ transport system membrane component KefB/Trk K+ transport system NAD-binding subunit